jgi:hypothetical protein
MRRDRTGNHHTTTNPYTFISRERKNGLEYDIKIKNDQATLISRWEHCEPESKMNITKKIVDQESQNGFKAKGT